MSAAFATVDGTDGRGGGPVGNQPAGTLMLTQTLASAGIGAQVHPVLVCRTVECCPTSGHRVIGLVCEWMGWGLG